MFDVFLQLTVYDVGRVVMLMLGMQKQYRIFGSRGTYPYTNGLYGKYTSVALF